jgi:undecaprenyl-diphosphatase
VRHSPPARSCWALSAGPLGSGIRGQVLSGTGASRDRAHLSVHFLTHYLANCSLRAFGVYCVIDGIAGLVYFSVR